MPHWREARIERSPLDAAESRHAVAYVGNPSAIELLTRILRPYDVPPDFAAMHYGAVHISPENLWYARNQVQAFQDDRSGHLPGIEAIRAALDDVAQQQKSFLLINDHQSVSDADRQLSFREELRHAMQAGLRGGGNLGKHVGPDQQRLLPESATRPFRRP
jgi:hypothetical protein